MSLVIEENLADDTRTNSDLDQHNELYDRNKDHRFPFIIADNFLGNFGKKIINKNTKNRQIPPKTSTGVFIPPRNKNHMFPFVIADQEPTMITTTIPGNFSRGAINSKNTKKRQIPPKVLMGTLIPPKTTTKPGKFSRGTKYKKRNKNTKKRQRRLPPKTLVVLIPPPPTPPVPPIPPSKSFYFVEKSPKRKNRGGGMRRL